MLVTKLEVGQQGSPELPQPQRPDLQDPYEVVYPLTVQAEPSAMQVPLKQQPLEQVLPAQHSSPGPPQEAHRPVLEVVLLQTVPAAQRSPSVVPVQQGWPGAPQAEQTLLRQANPLLQVLPQQGWPEPPQSAHLPPEHTPPPAPPVPVVVVLAQAYDSPTHDPL